MQLSNYLTKNYSLRKVELEGESPSTPIDSALTGERPHMDRDETGSSQRVPECQISSYKTFSARSENPSGI